MTNHTLKLKKPVAFLDLETTGINVSKDRIVEICLAKANVDGTVGNAIVNDKDFEALKNGYKEGIIKEFNEKNISIGKIIILNGSIFSFFNHNPIIEVLVAGQNITSKLFMCF